VNNKHSLTIMMITMTCLLALILNGCATQLEELPGLKPPQELAGPDATYIELGGYDVLYTDYGTDPFATAAEGLAERIGVSGDAVSRLTGQQPVLVLMHGFLSNYHTWDLIHPLVDSSFPVIAYDRMAFGLTERPVPNKVSGDFADGENPYAPEAVIERALELMDQLKGDSFVLFGNSAGGNLAVKLALDYPDRVRGLILIDPAIYENGAPSFITKLLNLSIFERAGIKFVRGLADDGEELLAQAWYNPALIPEDMLEHYRRPLQAQNWDRSLFEYTKASRDSGVSERLDELKLPVLIIHGREDAIVPLDQSERLAEEIDDARLVILDNCGHVPQEECPERTADAVNQFLNSM